MDNSIRMKKTEAINYILDNFDFELVHKAMTALNWTWRDGGVPAVSDLRQKARQLLSEIHIDNSGKGYYASGGFEVTALDGILKLDFVLESWDEEIAEVFSKTKQIQETINESKSSNEMKKTIAQQLNVTDFPFEIKDKNGNRIYYETSNGYWFKSEYDSNGNKIYYENSNGFWEKYEYDSDNNEIYIEDSDGVIKDNRPKDDVIILNGIKYKRVEE